MNAIHLFYFVIERFLCQLVSLNTQLLTYETTRGKLFGLTASMYLIFVGGASDGQTKPVKWQNSESFSASHCSFNDKVEVEFLRMTMFCSGKS